jgi:MSHA biogenesis protein MshE
MTFQSGAGCTYCNLSGHRGRTAVYELIEVDRVLADAIRNSDTGAFADAALLHPNYMSLTHSAIDLAAAGGTTLAEVIATTSGLDATQTNRPAAAPITEDELTDAVLSGRVR